MVGLLLGHAKHLNLRLDVESTQKSAMDNEHDDIVEIFRRVK
jgi:hypothetical protein